MATQANAFGSTIAFEQFKRGLYSDTIKKFRGINAFQSIATLSPDWAMDLLNVIVPISGNLSKFRLPTALTTQIGVSGPTSFWDYQQATGLRQLIASFGTGLYHFSQFGVGTRMTQGSAGTPFNSAGPWSAVTASNILFLANGQLMMKWVGVETRIVPPAVAAMSALQPWGCLQIQQAPPAYIIGEGGNPGNQPITGWIYAVALKNSVTGHIGPISPITATQLPSGTQAVALTSYPGDPAYSDPQYDTQVFFRSLDGGALLYRLCEVDRTTGNVTFNSATIGMVSASFTPAGSWPVYTVTDLTTPDTSLDLLTQANLINYPPPVGNFVVCAQGRIFVFGLQSNPSQIAYSGYEQVLIGRPEESFPPSNVLQLRIGADSCIGGGVLRNGIIAFSQTGRIYMLRGQVQDITTTAPVNFTSFLEEMDWKIGCLSAATIQSTAYGVIWMGADRSVQIMGESTGYQPQDISQPLYPLLRSITPGTESQCVSAYFNWLGRDWYTLTCCIGGAISPNRTFWWSLNQATQEIEIFISSVAGNWIGMVTTQQLQRILCIANGGVISQVPVDDTQNGMALDLTIAPATGGMLAAYWRSAYFGNTNPMRSKMYRYTRMLADQNVTAFQQTFRIVDNNTKTFAAPEILGPVPVPVGKMGLNRRGSRLSVEIDFPPADAPCNVLELTVAAIPTADR